MSLFFPGANSFDRVCQLRDDLSEHCLLGRRLLRNLHLLQLSRNRRKLKLSLNLLEGLVREIKDLLHRRCVLSRKKSWKFLLLVQTLVPSSSLEDDTFAKLTFISLTKSKSNSRHRVENSYIRLSVEIHFEICLIIIKSNNLQVKRKKKLFSFLFMIAGHYRDS
jgi:hypothetical protein